MQIKLFNTLEPPTVKISPSSGHMTSRKGGQVTFECQATGNPSPEIRWTKKNGYLDTGQKIETGYMLKINHVDRQHAGTYQCFADNGIGQAVTAEVQLHVLCTYYNTYRNYPLKEQLKTFIIRIIACFYRFYSSARN